MSWPWSELGLPGQADLAEVRRAYAERLKTTHPEEDPEGFQRLHEAYQQARRLARKGGGGENPAPSVRQTPPPQKPEEPQDEPEGGPEKKSEEEPESGPDWDYEDLLRKEEAPPKAPRPEEPDWDYEGIFTEEAAKRARKRQEHYEMRRESYFARHRPASPEEARRLEEQWANVERAIAAVEELSASGAPLSAWTGFLLSSVFFSVKGDEDFVVGLEEFLRRTPDLDEQVKTELIKAFNLRQPYVPSLWLGLQELLVDFSGREEKAKPRRKKSGKCGWTARMKTWTKGQRTAWTIVMIAAVSVLVLTISLGVRSEILGSGRTGAEERERLCQYMEEDFGRAVESHWKGRDNYENLYAPWDEPDLTFMAWPDGERDLAEGRRGYTTNYSSVMVTQALKNFAKEWGYELELLQEGGCDGVMGAYGTSPGGYVLKLPLWGAEDGITALGGLMAELEAEPWYQAFPPSYELHFAYQSLNYLTCTCDGPFDADAVRDYYENKMGVGLCGFLVEESGLAREDFGGDGYRLEPQGSVELSGLPYFLVSGVDGATGETVRQYLFNGMMLASLPAEEFSLDLKAYQIYGDRFDSPWEDMPRYVWITRR